MTTINEMKNLIIAELGFVDSIDFTDTSIATVNKVNRIYPTSKEFILSSYNWRFVMKRAILNNPIQRTDTFTANVSDTITMTSTDRYVWNGLQVKLTTTGTLPAGLALDTIYYVISASTNTCELSLTSGGTKVDITDVGTGTHTITFQALNVSPYKYHYNTPTDTLALRKAFVDREERIPILDYEYDTDGFFTNDIYSTDKTIRFWYNAELDEDYWPSYFVAYFKYALAFDLCFLLTGDTSREETLFKIQEQMLISSKNIDAKQVKTRIVKSSPFVDIRGRNLTSGNGISNV